MKALWQMWEGAIDGKTCDRIIEQAMKLPSQKGIVGTFDPKQIDEIRDAEIRWIDKFYEPLKDIHGIVDWYIEEANKNAYGVDTKCCENLQFTTYDSKTNGHYDWHEDVFWERQDPFDRKLSFVLQLSDINDYDGGQLQLEHWAPPPQDKLKRRGTVIVFPAFLKHRVTPVTAGIRHSLVCWKLGPKWR